MRYVDFNEVVLLDISIQYTVILVITGRKGREAGGWYIVNN